MFEDQVDNLLGLSRDNLYNFIKTNTHDLPLFTGKKEKKEPTTFAPSIEKDLCQFYQVNS